MQKPKEIKILDSLRGIFSFLVLFLHCCLPNIKFISLEAYEYFTFAGHLSVDAFFFLSGFVITYIYQQIILDALQIDKKLFFRKFAKYFVNRIARLYPLVFFSETMLLIIKWGKVGWECLYEYFLVCAWFDKWSGNTPLWSLNAELLLYLLFPLFIWINYKINPTKKIWISIALSLIVPIGFNLTRPFYSYPDDFFPIFNAGPLYRGIQGFYAGICLYQVYELNTENDILFDILAGASLLINILIILFVSQTFSYVYIWFLFVFFMVKSKWMRKAFENKLFLFFGDISFSLYLLHYPIVIALNLYIGTIIKPDQLNNKSRFFIWLGFVSFMIVYSYVVYAFYEIPSRNYLRKLWEKIDYAIFDKRRDEEKLLKEDKEAVQMTST